MVWASEFSLMAFFSGPCRNRFLYKFINKCRKHDKDTAFRKLIAYVALVLLSTLSCFVLINKLMTITPAVMDLTSNGMWHVQSPFLYLQLLGFLNQILSIENMEETVTQSIFLFAIKRNHREDDPDLEVDEYGGSQHLCVRIMVLLHSHFGSPIQHRLELSPKFVFIHNPAILEVRGPLHSHFRSPIHICSNVPPPYSDAQMLRPTVLSRTHGNRQLQ